MIHLRTGELLVTVCAPQGLVTKVLFHLIYGRQLYRSAALGSARFGPRTPGPGHPSEIQIHHSKLAQTLILCHMTVSRVSHCPKTPR